MEHDFSEDRPIQSIDEDLLDRGRFAVSLATAIAGWKGKDSLVIALNGDWGSGKSSVKNMALSAFEAHGLDAPAVVEFNPWQWAGQEKITKSFFEELASSIGKEDAYKKRKKIAEKIRRYGTYLNSGAHIVTGLTQALPTLFLLAAALGLGGVFVDQQWIKNTFAALTVVLVGWAAILKWGGGLAERITTIVDSYSQDGEPTLETLKSELAGDLKSLEKSILVIIDDIDRLTTEETRSVFQLIKANADFPNLVYLLLFQRDLVEARLSDERQSGTEYLEKIVQVPFDIPWIDQGRTDKILFAGLDRILTADQLILKRFDQTRWGNVFFGGMRPYFTNLRSVYRYSSTLSFHVALLKGKKAFEVNPVDLMAVECLRVFEPTVYRRISLSRTLLTSSHTEHGEIEHARKEVEAIVSLATEERRDSVKEILKQLFPRAGTVLGGMGYGAEWADTWFKELRVCHPDLFSRYFQFSVQTGEVSQSELEEVIELSGNRGELVQKLNALKESGRLKGALSQLDTYKQDIPLKDWGEFIPALMDIADSTEDESGGFAGFSAHRHLVRIVLWYLRQDPSAEARGGMLLAAFSKTDGVSLMADLLSGEESRRTKEGAGDMLLLDDAALDAGRRAFTEKLESITKGNPQGLLHNIHLATLLFRWKEWGGLESIRAWAHANISTAADVLVFLEGFTSQGISQGINDYVSKVRYRINLGHIETFFSLEKVQELSAQVNIEKLSERQKQVMDALARALRRRGRGLSDDGWRDDEEED